VRESTDLPLLLLRILHKCTRSAAFIHDVELEVLEAKLFVTRAYHPGRFVGGGWSYVQLKLIERDSQLYLLVRSLDRADKEDAIRLRELRGLGKVLSALSRSVRTLAHFSFPAPVTVGFSHRVKAATISVVDDRVLTFSSAM
jgi:hypothetical protein